MEAENSEDRIKKFRLKELDIQVWIRRNGLEKDMRKDIKENINENWEEIRNADIENLFSVLPVKSRKFLKRSLCMETLRKVPRLQTLEDEALTLICAFLKPVVYKDNSFGFKAGEPLDRILFITEGLIWTYQTAGTTDSSTSRDGKGKTCFSFLEKGGFYGDDQLLSWAIASHKNDLSFSNLPISKVNVKCHAKVEGFVLMAKNLKTVVSHYKLYWGFHDSYQERDQAALQAIKDVVRHNKDRPRRPPTISIPAWPPASVVSVDQNSPTTAWKEL